MTSSAAAPSSSMRVARASPFRESEWDRKLDSLLEDLEGSGGGGGGGGGGGASHKRQIQSYSQSSGGHQQSSYSATSLASQLRSEQQQQLQSSSYSSSSSRQQQQQQQQDAGGSQLANGYSVAKSQSAASLHDNMLKDLEGSLKASSNYLESHRTVTGPGSRSEFHEYRSYFSDGSGGERGGERRRGAGSDHVGGGGGDFNLERQVQHMMPPGSLVERNGGFESSSGLQSANMVSSVQQKQSYTSYKVQSNQYGSSGERIEQHHGGGSGDRPGSRLKQNIDELDTLLYDLNNAQQRKVTATSDAGGDYTASSITPGNVSDDYSFHEGSQGHVRRTTQAYNQQSYQVASTSPSQAKPPSPSVGRRTQSSPPTTRRADSPHRPQFVNAGLASSSSYKYSYSSTRDQQQERQTTGYTSSYPPAAEPERTLTPSQPLPSHDGKPAGVTYYTKYHSTHSHASQGGGPASFPSTPPSRPAPHTQTPPKRVDQLMTELSEFDSSIQDTRFAEPPGAGRRDPSPDRYRPPAAATHRDPSPERRASPVRPQQSTPGPAVYYPPGEMFKSPRAESHLDTSSFSRAQAKGKGKAKAKGEYKAKEKSKISDGEGKQGAAVVPICLPLCCAAPCVIM